MDKPVGTLYSFPPESYTRIKYFKNKSVELLKKAHELIKSLSPSDDLDIKALKDIVDQTLECLKQQIRLLVLGEDTIETQFLVQKLENASGSPTLVYDCKRVEFGAAFDLVIYPLSHIKTGAKDTQKLTHITDCLGQSSFLQKLFVVAPQRPKQEFDPKAVLSNTFEGVLRADNIKECKAKLSTWNNLSKRISARLERRILESLKILEERLKKLQDHIQRYPKEKSEEKIRSVFRENRYVEGWRAEFEREQIDIDPVFQQMRQSCQHETKIEHCCDCYILHRMSLVLGRFIGQIVHKELPSKRIVSENRAVSLDNACVEFTHAVSEFLFKTVYSSKVIGIKRFSNARVANYYTMKISNLCRDISCSEAEDVERLRFQIGSLLAQSHIPEFKTYLKEHLEKSLPAGMCEKLFERVPSVKACGYHLSRLQVEIKSEDYEENQMAIDFQVREFLSTQQLNTEYMDVRRAEGIQMHLVEVGSKIENELGTQATLGGFANMTKLVPNPECPTALNVKPPDNPGMATELCALMSNHIVPEGDGKTKLFVVTDGEKQEMGKCVNAKKQEGIFDIMAVTINDRLERKICTKFKNSSGESCECKLFKFDTTEGLSGKSVHIFGAQSVPGKGIIVGGDFKTREENDQLSSLVIVANGDVHGKPFSTPGDSGAIVVSDEPDETVLVLSMLIGKNNGNDNFVTFRLIDGFRSLERRLDNGVTFALCDVKNEREDEDNAIYD